MQITLNGQPIETQKVTLEELLVEQGYNDCTVATAMDKHFVPVAERSLTPLTDGCVVDVVAPMQGG